MRSMKDEEEKESRKEMGRGRGKARDKRDGMRKTKRWEVREG